MSKPRKFQDLVAQSDDNRVAEALDRVHLVADSAQRHLLGHTFFLHPDHGHLRNQVKKALRLLEEVHQTISGLAEQGEARVGEARPDPPVPGKVLASGRAAREGKLPRRPVIRNIREPGRG